MYDACLVGLEHLQLDYWGQNIEWGRSITFDHRGINSRKERVKTSHRPVFCMLRGAICG